MGEKKDIGWCKNLLKITKEDNEMIQTLFNTSWSGQSPCRNCKMGQKTGSFHRIENKEQGREKQSINIFGEERLQQRISLSWEAFGNSQDLPSGAHQSCSLLQLASSQACSLVEKSRNLCSFMYWHDSVNCVLNELLGLAWVHFFLNGTVQLAFQITNLEYNQL